MTPEDMIKKMTINIVGFVSFEKDTVISPSASDFSTIWLVLEESHRIALCKKA
jgi:hypothetical protein